MTNTKRANIIMLISACLIPFLASFVYFDWLDGSAAAKWVYGLAKIFIVVFPVFALARVKGFFDTLRPNDKDITRGLLAMAGIFIVFYAALHSPLWQFIETGRGAVIAKMDNFSIGGGVRFLVFALVISLIHSLVEEYYWRWFVLGELKKYVSRYKAHALAAGAFSLHHFVVCKYYFPVPTALVLTLVVFCGGLLFNILYEKSGRLCGAWLAHIAADLCIFYTGYLLL